MMSNTGSTTFMRLLRQLSTGAFLALISGAIVVEGAGAASLSVNRAFADAVREAVASNAPADWARVDELLALSPSPDVNFNDGSGHPPFVMAVAANRLNFAAKLIKLGADPNIRSKFTEVTFGGRIVRFISCNSALSCAFVSERLSYRERITITEFMLKAGADPRHTFWYYPHPERQLAWQPLEFSYTKWAVREGWREIAVMLIGAAKAKGKWNCEADRSGSTLLHAAARVGRADMIPVLVENGCDANARDGSNETPLTVAITKNERSAADALRRYGAR